MISKMEQDSLFPYDLVEILSKHSLSIASVTQLYEDDYLSFDPSEKTELNAFEYYELDFVCSLFTSDLSLDSIKTLLSKLNKPYCYDISKVYFDFTSKDWEKIPLPEEPELPAIEDLINNLVEEEDYEKLEDIHSHILNILAERKQLDDSVAPNLKPDLGLYFQKLSLDNPVLLFYKVLIFGISHVGHNLYTCNSVATYDDIEYSGSFDFNTPLLNTLLEGINDEIFNDSLIKKLFNNYTQPETTQFMDNPIQVDIKAYLGQPVKSLFETFIPFIVEEFSNVKWPVKVI